MALSPDPCLPQDVRRHLVGAGGELRGERSRDLVGHRERRAGHLSSEVNEGAEVFVRVVGSRLPLGRLRQLRRVGLPRRRHRRLSHGGAARGGGGSRAHARRHHHLADLVHSLAANIAPRRLRGLPRGFRWRCAGRLARGLGDVRRRRLRGCVEAAWGLLPHRKVQPVAPLRLGFLFVLHDQLVALRRGHIHRDLPPLFRIGRALWEICSEKK
mmetsp:Transcript_12729/g.33022  ORF Transcript_12729/g.33022 Transcript_12729/m.33022 type:complete len:213 (-) Transcript_12729:1074-1712(-)